MKGATGKFGDLLKNSTHFVFYEQNRKSKACYIYNRYNVQTGKLLWIVEFKFFLINQNTVHIGKKAEI